MSFTVSNDSSSGNFETVPNREPLANKVRKIFPLEKLLLEDIKYLEDTRNKIIYSMDIPDSTQLMISAGSVNVVLHRLGELASEEQRTYIDEIARTLKE
ncbi:MAG: hypothetical protein ACM3ZR_06265 [Pseudomonadota bacterium]